MQQALVLGGGGFIGVAWESGLLSGLAEAGIDRAAFDLVVGTSAGAIVGARLLGGHDLESGRRSGTDSGAAQRDATGGTTAGSAEQKRAKGALDIDATTLDVAALGRVFQLWGALERTTPAAAREIGSIVRGLYRDREPAWVAGIADSASAGAWPDTPLRISAVGLDSGEPTLFDRNSGVELARAIAASAAVPGLFPSVTIDGRLYMDGGVHSSTHADAVVGDALARVLVLMPMNTHTAKSVGAHAERALEAELLALRASGTEVRVQTPSAEDAERMGGNLMDTSKMPDAFEVGLATGRAWATQLG